MSAHSYLGNVIWCQLNFDGHYKRLVNTLPPFLSEVLTTSGIQVEEKGQETFGYALKGNASLIILWDQGYNHLISEYKAWLL